MFYVVLREMSEERAEEREKEGVKGEALVVEFKFRLLHGAIEAFSS